MTDSDVMQCTNCGYTCRRRNLEWKQTQKTRYHCEPSDDCENWYETRCPQCGKIETMEESADVGAAMDWTCDTRGPER